MENFVQADRQNEDAGSKVFAKYWYQYNWALIRFLDECEKNNDCSLSIECHEDVMIIDSDCMENSMLELYQVKERSQSPDYSAKALAYSSSSTKTKSVISKLVSNLDKVHLKNRIKRLALVSATPFNLKIDGDYKSSELDSFKWEQLSEVDSNILLDSIKKDLGRDEIPLFIEFIKGIEGHSEEVHSSITFKKMSEYIEELEPKSAHKPKIIFELLKSQLVKIGTNTETYTLWHDFLRHKTISSQQLNEMIKKRSVSISSGVFDSLWDSITDEGELKTLPLNKRTILKKLARNYYSNRLISADSVYVDISELIQKILYKVELANYNDYVSYILIELKKNKHLIEFFDNNELKMKSAIMIELSENI